MSGRELQAEQSKLGVSPEAVAVEAGVSMSTLYKVYAGEQVRESSLAKVRNALGRMRARLVAQTGGKVAVG